MQGNKIEVDQKKEIFEYMKSEAKRLKIDISAVNKTAVANQFAVSPRTVGRVLEKFKNGSDASTTATTPKKAEKISTKSLQSAATPKAGATVINWTVTQASVLLTLSDGNNASITKDNKNYRKVVDMLITGDTNVMELVNPAKNFEYTYGNVTVIGDTVTFDDHVVDKKIAFFVIDAIKRGDVATAERLTKFLNNLLQNPSFRATQTLYAFICHNDIKIDDDGMLLAWKRINANFTDCYTGTIDNSVGTVVKVIRNHVEENPNQTCAQGLHLCAKSYLSHYKGDVVVQCLLNPRDVVAVPIDYSGAKLRCCEYKVLKDVTKEWKDGKL